MSGYRITYTDLTDAIRSSRAALNDLEKHLSQLLARAQTADGYPAGGQNGSSSPGHSDPTLAAVIIRETKTNPPAAKALLRLWHAAKTLDSANSFRHKALPPTDPQPNADDPDLWCANCAKHGMHSPRRGDGSKHCRFCGQFNRDHGCMPPKSILDRHSRAGQITSRDLAAAGIAPLTAKA